MHSSMFLRLLSVAAIGLLAACAAPLKHHETLPALVGAEIDAVAVNPKKYTVLLENEYVRVIRYVIQPGESEEIHTHPPKLSYVLSGGDLRIVPEQGDAFDVKEAAGESVWRDAVGKHHAENTGTTPVAILLVEVKAANKTP